MELPRAPNIEDLNQHLEYEVLRKYRNKCAVHLCPSEAEGFGHCIVEAMSCEAVVVTTDAPPMNELVTANRGVLVRAARSEPMRLGSRYFVDVDDLELQIGRVIAMKPEERRALGENARQWYLVQREAFRNAMKAFLVEVQQDGPTSKHGYRVNYLHS
jgi:glycosyltransferase involved in cell wall biosynthesis